MKILYLGDVMGEPGIKVVEHYLPQVINQHQPDIVIAQAENVTNGKGMSVSDMQRLRQCGINFFTGGNHTPVNRELHSLLQNPESPVIGPANMPECPGLGWKYAATSRGDVLIVSLLGNIVGKQSERVIDNPLETIDRILKKTAEDDRLACIVNFHGDFSSQKRIIGYYLDGRVTAVIGDHWHVPTADELLLPKGTAHITDVGMCGSLDSSLGVSFDSVIPRWKSNQVTKNKLEAAGRMQFNSVLITSKSDGLAESIEAIRSVF